MRTMSLLVLKDLKAEAFMTPFFAPTNGVAFRELQDQLRKGGDGNVLASHPEDFELYELGSFDPADGGLFVHDQPALLTNVAKLITPPQ